MKAIETSYKGYRFRSRLEARWAVFFDSLGVKWEYEPEGFDLRDGVRYLPDFRLWGVSLNEHRPIFAEVKPFYGDDAKAKLFSKSSVVEQRSALGGPFYFGTPLVLMLYGPPDFQVYEMLCNGKVLFHAAFFKQHSGHTVLTRVQEETARDRFHNRTIEDAVEASRSARFEFGECGA